MAAIFLAYTTALVTPSFSRRAGTPSCETTMAADALYSPTKRDARYNGNMAQYIVDLHDSSATFDFCGGMLFQLSLSEKLRSHLAGLASTGGDQLVVHGADKARMALIPGYSQSSAADDLQVFHGREIRNVPNAAGGMQFVLHLSLANGDDPEGWCVPCARARVH